MKRWSTKTILSRGGGVSFASRFHAGNKIVVFAWRAGKDRNENSPDAGLEAGLAGLEGRSTNSGASATGLPVGEGVGARVAGGGDEFGEARAAFVEALEELRQGILFAGDPVGGDALPGLVHDFFGKVHHLVQPGLEVFEGTNLVVDQAAGVEA